MQLNGAVNIDDSDAMVNVGEDLISIELQEVIVTFKPQSMAELVDYLCNETPGELLCTYLMHQLEIITDRVIDRYTTDEVHNSWCSADMISTLYTPEHFVYRTVISTNMRKASIVGTIKSEFTSDMIVRTLLSMITDALQIVMKAECFIEFNDLQYTIHINW